LALNEIRKTSLKELGQALLRLRAGVGATQLARTLALAVLALGLCVGLWAYQQKRAAAEALGAQSALQARMSQAQLAARLAQAAASSPSQDFVVALPWQDAPEPFLDVLRRACESKGVSLQAVAVASQAATPKALSRHRVSASLRGSYGAIKLVLADVSQRTPGRLLTQSLSMRRSTAGTPDIEAKLEFALLGRPSGLGAP